MSIKVMQQVWEASRQKGSALLLLLAIADHAHDDGAGAYPSVETLARKVRMTGRNTQMLIRRLEQAGEIEVERSAGPGGCNLYRVKTFQGVKTSVAGGEKQRRERVKGLSPRTIMEPSEPSEEEKTSQNTPSRACADSSSPEPSHPDPLFEAVAEACAIDVLVCTKEQRGALNQTVSIFRKAGRTADQVRGVRRWWDENDWRAKKGGVPTPSQLREVWGQASAQQRRLDAQWRAYRERELRTYLECRPDDPDRANIDHLLKLLPTISREDYNLRREALLEHGVPLS